MASQIPSESNNARRSTMSSDGFNRGNSTDSFQGSFSDGGHVDNDDQYEPEASSVKVDLSQYLIPSVREELVEVENGEDENEDGSEEEDEDGEDEEQEEGDEEEEEDDEYEEYEDYGEEEDGLGLADEVLTDTLSREVLRQQREYNKIVLKEKKKELVNEYLTLMKHFSHLRAKNTLLGLKIISNVGNKKAIVDKYIQREMEEQERLREAERLKTLHLMENCEALGKSEKDPAKEAIKAFRKKHKNKMQSSKGRRHSAGTASSHHTRFSDDPDSLFASEPKPRKLNRRSVFTTRISEDPPEDTPVVVNDKSKKVCEDEKVKEKHIDCIHHDALRYRRRKRVPGFTYQRSRFFKEDTSYGKRRNSDLMALRLSVFGLKDTRRIEGKGPRPKGLIDAGSTSKAKKSAQLKNLVAGKPQKKIFSVTGEALGLYRSKKRMALRQDKVEQKIQLESPEVGTENLNHFHFEFADPRLTAKQASLKLRGELMRLLKHRHIPTTQYKWPMQIKGINFETENPYGRVVLNYTRLSHHEKEHPYTAYRILLTNIGYFKTKEQKMKEVHRQNMINLEEERVRLDIGINQIMEEIIDGLRIYASLCGITTSEKRIAKRETEEFILYFQESFYRLVYEMLMKLYNTIQMTEFALRRLSISEGKGEGAELHEFKDIMRCREKLKAEHKQIQKGIARYQHHSKEVLEHIRKTGHRLHNMIDAVGTMNLDFRLLGKAVTTMIDGMYYCHRLAQHQLEKERWLSSEIGILACPKLAEDYDELIYKIQNTKMKKIDLQRQYNAHVREIHKITPIR